jgi:hypothetical protein
VLYESRAPRAGYLELVPPNPPPLPGRFHVPTIVNEFQVGQINQVATTWNLEPVLPFKIAISRVFAGPLQRRCKPRNHIVWARLDQYMSL